MILAPNLLIIFTWQTLTLTPSHSPQDIYNKLVMYPKATLDVFEKAASQVAKAHVFSSGLQPGFALE